MIRQDLGDLVDVMGRFDHAMLITARDDELRSRPMAIADHTDDGRIRFITRDDSGKLDELDAHPQVNVAMQGDGRYLSVSGRARLTRDEALVDRCWQEHQQRWFAEGRDDPHVMVLEVVPTCAEYWDRSESGLARLVPGPAGAADTEDHAKVDLGDEPL